MKEFQFETADASLKVYEYGRSDAPAVVLLHGGPGMVGYMQPLGELLSGGARIIDYYQRGAFLSPSKASFLIRDHVEDLKNVLDRFAPDEAPTLVGHSWGAVLGLEFCMAHPGRVAKLVLIGCGPLNAVSLDDFIANIYRRLSPQAASRIRELDGLLDDPSLSESQVLELDREYLEIILPVYQHDAASAAKMKLHLRPRRPFVDTNRDYTRRRNDGSLVRELKLIREPVVAFHGESDVIAPGGVLSVLRAGLANYKEYLIPESGHMPWLEPNSASEFEASFRREALVGA